LNHLAHCLLSGDDTSLLLGNFIADFVGIKEADLLPSNIKQGIELHKIIDEFTDHHPLVGEAKSLLYPTQGKYAPVTIDILFDHFLIQSWDIYSNVPLTSFVDDIYIKFQTNFDFFSDTMKPRVTMMITHDFLHSCEDEPRLRSTFNRMVKRASFPNNFVTAYDDMMDNYEELNSVFNSFFPELKAEAQDFIDSLTTDLP